MALSTRSSVVGGDEPLFLVDVEEFHGPLDLLLHLIREQDIEIFDVPIARITRQFLGAIEGIRAEEIDHAGEFLEMAATLVRIKVQMLLPTREEEHDEDPRAELVRRLLEYEQIQEVATRFETAEAERSRRFAKGWIPDRPGRGEGDEAEDPREVPLKADRDDLMEAAMGLRIRRLDPEEHRVSVRTVEMRDKIELIRETLRRAGRVEFRSLVRPWKRKVHGVMTLMASLELARRRVVALRQTSLFADLWLYRGDADDAAETWEDDGGSGDSEEREESTP